MTVQLKVSPVAATILAGMAGGAMVVLLPGILTMVAQVRHWPDVDIATLASVELGGICVGTLLASAVIARIDRRWLAFCLCALFLSLQWAAVGPLGFRAFMLDRFGSGMIEGMLIASTAATFAGMPHPERNFALYLSTNLVAATVTFALLGSLADQGHGLWIFAWLGGLSAIGALMARALPRARPPAHSVHAVPSPGGQGWGAKVVGLAATGLLFTAIGATWPLVGQLGGAHGLAGGTIGNALSVASLFGIAAGISAAALATRLGRRVPLAVGTLGLMLCMSTLYAADGALAFTATVCGYMYFWIIATSYFTGVMSALDPRGHIASLSIAMQFFGLALGPYLAGFLITGAGIDAVVWLGVAVCLPALILILLIERQVARLALAAPV